MPFVFGQFVFGFALQMHFNTKEAGVNPLIRGKLTGHFDSPKARQISFLLIMAEWPCSANLIIENNLRVRPGTYVVCFKLLPV
jgi:hypothetical protein